MQQACLDNLFRTGVALLADTRGLADALFEVVQLGAAHVTASSDLDLLDLRRVQRESTADANTERLLANREGLAHAVALALDDDALEHLRTAAVALDDLEVHADAVSGLE